MTIDLPGFSDPVTEAQTCFRAVLTAMSHPGKIVALRTTLKAPSPLASSTGAVLLTLADPDTPVWLESTLTPATAWMRFHCGAIVTESKAAIFGVCLALPSLDAFGWGSHDGPETGATIILQCPSLATGPLLRLSGPGLQEPVTVRLGLPEDFASRWEANHAAFPGGVDLILCGDEEVAALPRSLQVETV
jgi:alpha-D-ribose 1-methylphosphonate 5-triphosphate synthase subunit PhnH